jgi:hypothetical protein
MVGAGASLVSAAEMNAELAPAGHCVETAYPIDLNLGSRSTANARTHHPATSSVLG